MRMGITYRLFISIPGSTTLAVFSLFLIMR